MLIQYARLLTCFLCDACNSNAPCFEEPPCSVVSLIDHPLWVKPKAVGKRGLLLSIARLPITKGPVRVDIRVGLGSLALTAVAFVQFLVHFLLKGFWGLGFGMSVNPTGDIHSSSYGKYLDLEMFLRLIDGQINPYDPICLNLWKYGDGVYFGSCRVLFVNHIGYTWAFSRGPPRYLGWCRLPPINSM